MTSNLCKVHILENKPCKRCKATRDKSALKLKKLCMQHYGSLCACCGESEIKFLCLDHIDGGGNAHRVEIFGTKNVGGEKMYRWVRNNNFPDGFQFLCFNCNCAKHYFGECPHDK